MMWLRRCIIAMVFASMCQFVAAAEQCARPEITNMGSVIDSGTWIGHSIDERNEVLLQTNRMLPTVNTARGFLIKAKGWVTDNAGSFVDNLYSNGDYTVWLNATSYWAYTFLDNSRCKIDWYPGALGPFYDEVRANSGPPKLGCDDVVTRAMAPTNYLRLTTNIVWASENEWLHCIDILKQLVWTSYEGVWSTECVTAVRTVATGRTGCWDVEDYLPPDELGGPGMPYVYIDAVNNGQYGEVSTNSGWIGNHWNSWAIRVYRDYASSDCDDDAYRNDWMITARWGWYPSAYAASVAPAEAAMFPMMDVYKPSIRYGTNEVFGGNGGCFHNLPYAMLSHGWKNYSRIENVTYTYEYVPTGAIYLTAVPIEWDAEEPLEQNVGGEGCAENVDNQWYYDVGLEAPRPSVISILRWNVVGAFKYY